MIAPTPVDKVTKPWTFTMFVKASFFRSIFFIFHYVEVSPNGSFILDKITYSPSMFSFVVANLDISKITHKSKKL